MPSNKTGTWNRSGASEPVMPRLTSSSHCSEADWVELVRLTTPPERLGVNRAHPVAPVTIGLLGTR